AVREIRATLTQQDGRECYRRDPDRDVDEEDPGPAQVRREQAAEQDADRRAASRGGAVDAEREVALAAFGEDRHQEGQSRRREQRATESLDRPKRDQRRLRPGEPAEQRTDRAEAEAPQEDRA